MIVCVAGWYFGDLLYKTIAESRYPCFCVAHKPIPRDLLVKGLTIPNVGLEFGCYDWFLKNRWAEDCTLFIHDDNEISAEALDRIAAIKVDQAFLFSTRNEIAHNGGAHGRAIFCSQKFLRRLRKDGGFWFDESEHANAPTTGKPDFHNNGIQMFVGYIRSLKKELSVGHQIVVHGLVNGCRGEVKNA